MKEKVADLELSIMSCLLIRPELMEKLFVEDKHFVKHKRLWQFMKVFYDKYKTFDAQIMYSVCKDKKQILEYILWLYDLEIATFNFEVYQKELIRQYETSEQDKIKINLIYKWANELWVGSLKLTEFKSKVNELLKEEN